MRLPWPRRWRRRPKSVKYVGQHRPGSWAEVALPPKEGATPVVPAPAASEPTVAPLPPSGTPAEPLPAAGSTVIVTSGPAVRLGFSDGSSLLLDDGSDQAAALRSIATSLAFKNEPVEDR